jgi:hypothetical protein
MDQPEISKGYSKIFRICDSGLFYCGQRLHYCLWVDSRCDICSWVQASCFVSQASLPVISRGFLLCFLARRLFLLLEVDSLALRCFVVPVQLECSTSLSKWLSKA